MLPSISSDFNKSNEASWLGTSWAPRVFHTSLLPLTAQNRYLLATCSFTPLYGRLSNVLGRKRANQTALFFAGLGVLMCGLSTNMEMLIVARFVRLHPCRNLNELNPLFLVVRNWWRWLIYHCIVSFECPSFTKKKSQVFLVSLSVICIAFG